MTLLLALISAAVWVYLLLGRRFFWLARDRDDRSQPPGPAAWPSVCALVPARDEADVIADSISSLLSQDYPGPFQVILIDDGSADGTADAAAGAARALGAGNRLTILRGAPPPSGWTGKLWALEQGSRTARGLEPSPEHLLLTDADIAHSPDNLRRLVARAEAEGLVLVSLMAKLHCTTLAERALIPAFVFFFDMLYPFAAVNDPDAPTAAAAGGCMLVRRAPFEDAAGVASVRSALIDDCALGALMKRRGPIWLGLSDRARSLRPYRTVGEVARMISRSAYAQLRYSPWRLAGALLGLLLTYAAPPVLALLARGWPERLGLASWILMSLSFQPMLRFYGRSPAWGPALPLVAGFYAGCTLLSAVDVWRGRGGIWKGRVQALAHRS